MELEEKNKYILKLINLYRSHPILWDLKAAHCKKSSKTEIYHFIAKEMNSTVEMEEHERKRSYEEDANCHVTDNKKERIDKGSLNFRYHRVRRYKVQIPKALLTIKSADTEELRQRYAFLSIPSDFFLANSKWSEYFPPDKPFSIKRPCQFHIMHDMSESPSEQDTLSLLLEPADANYLYSAKVMLLALPPIAEIYEKCFENDNDSAHNPVHLWRLMNFLVGVEGDVETMAIGGPWSASLDGENPDKDPAVLIRTAIRTCKALTGINLSNCTQWYRFLEIYYHRKDDKEEDDYVETVVIYLPEVHSLMPTQAEWKIFNQVYKNAVDNKDTSHNDEMNGYSTLNQNAVREHHQDTKTRNGTNTTVIIYDETDQEVTIIDDDDSEREGSSNVDTENDNPKSPSYLDKKVQNNLPASPHVIARPNRQAKGGKFNCVAKSLTVLLDYHPDDLKESSFEISLFAEFFNDMLMRDFGFHIYKEIDQLKEPETKNNVSEITVEQNGTQIKIKKELIIDIDDDENISSNGYESDQTQKNNDSPALISQTSIIYKNIINPELLLSFIYFDTTQCGYIMGKDLEHLFYVLDLNLTRSQICKTLQKLDNFESSEPIHYRKLTHVHEEEEEDERLECIPEIEFVNIDNFESVIECKDDDSENDSPYLISSEEESSDSSNCCVIASKYSDKEIVLALIDEYSKVPQLLNKTIEEIYNFKYKQKDTLYQTLTTKLNARLKLNLSLSMVRKKLIFICNLYENEIERRLTAGKAPNTASQWLYDKMSFLEPTVKNKLGLKVSQSKHLTIPLDDRLLYDIINIYKDYKQLWDTTHLGFCDVEKRAELMLSLLNEIKEKMNLALTMSQLKQQLKYIHKSYSKDKGLRLECEINQMTFQPTFLCFYQCHFLESHESPYKCPECNFITESNWLLKKHKSKHKASKPFKCSECGKEYESAGYYNYHVKSHLKKTLPTKKLWCKSCPAKFDLKEQLVRHVRTHERLCNICSASFPTEKPYFAHMKRHEEKHKYFCHICQEGFFLKISLHNHIRRHVDLNDKICDICNKTFDNSLFVYKHRQRVHATQFGIK